MKDHIQALSVNTNNVNSFVSLDPLLDFWEEKMVPNCSHMAAMFADLKEKISQNSALEGLIHDVDVLNDNRDIITPLMSVAFPSASFHKDIMGALKPCTFEPFFVTSEFQRLFLDNKNFFKPELLANKESDVAEKLMYVYCLVLQEIYGFDCQQLDKLNIKTVPDEKTGLDRYYRITPDFQFVRVTALEQPPQLSKNDITTITDHLTDISVLSRYIDLSKFQFTGFTIVKAVDITESQIVSMLEKDLIDEHSIFSSDGIKLLESRIQVLFQLPDLSIGIGSLQGDQVMLIKNDCSSNINCLFSNSHHLNLEDIKGSVWSRAAEINSVLRIADLSEKTDLLPLEQHAVSHGVKSMLLSPLLFQGDIIGLLEVFTSTPNNLGSMEALLLEQITPIFSSALKRGQDELHKHVQSIIKEKCTAVHPSVEWRFEKAAMDHMERLRSGDTASEMENIIFKDVVPFYGQSDIRGSSLARNKGIQQDLIQQLTLGLNIMKVATKERSWPLLREFKYRIETMIQEVSYSVTSGDEDAVFSLLQKEMSPIFDDITKLGSDVTKQIAAYTSAIDPVKGIIYHKRKEYEESVFKLNTTLAGYLDQEDSLIQDTFPHYFEKHQTDGVDYMMYIGSSMMENQKFAGFHIKNLTLWQIMIACGLARQTEQIKPELKIPLDTCHLILVNHNPLSIRFRFDEKKFDVDGAYDVRHEIIKSRLDKALIKGSRERLTQPGKIAVVYSNPAEGRDIRHHIDFLKDIGKLTDNIETLDLDDMPDVNGLKAIRVEVNLESSASKAQIIEMKTG
jgi:hypothetical protein